MTMKTRTILVRELEPGMIIPPWGPVIEVEPTGDENGVVFVTCLYRPFLGWHKNSPIEIEVIEPGDA